MQTRRVLFVNVGDVTLRIRLKPVSGAALSKETVELLIAVLLSSKGVLPVAELSQHLMGISPSRRCAHRAPFDAASRKNVN